MPCNDDVLSSGVHHVPPCSIMFDTPLNPCIGSPKTSGCFIIFLLHRASSRFHAKSLKGPTSGTCCDHQSGCTEFSIWRRKLLAASSYHTVFCWLSGFYCGLRGSPPCILSQDSQAHHKMGEHGIFVGPAGATAIFGYLWVKDGPWWPSWCPSGGVPGENVSLCWSGTLWDLTLW